MPAQADRIFAKPESPVNWAVRGDLLVVLVTRAEPIPEDVFTLFIADVRNCPWTKCLGATLGGLEMTSVQRSQVAAEFKGKQTAAVTDNSVARGVATALSWLGLQIRAWSWDNIQNAFDYLNLNEDDRKAAEQIVEHLKMNS